MPVPKSVFILAFAGLAASLAMASVASAKDYAYTAPTTPAVTEALQTPDKTPDASTYADLGKRAGNAAIDTTPGLIRPATRIAEWTSHDDDHRGFACADKKCKTFTPVYNSRTPLEQEQGRLGVN
jgi:hypothetical protein